MYYYKEIFTKNLNEKNKFLNEILKEKKLNEFLILNINKPRKKLRSILKTSFDYLIQTYKEKKNKTKSLSKKPINIEKFNSSNIFYFILIKSTY